jgi:hypothetical protein
MPLLRNDAAMVTGASVVADGGIVLHRWIDATR